MHLKQISALISILFIIAFFSACIPGLTVRPTATPIPPTVTPTPLPRTLKICLGREPDSLYPFGTSSQVSWDVLDAVFDGPIDIHGYQPSAVILEKIPSLSDNGITFDPVDVKAGDEVIDVDGNPVSLIAGVAVFPHGCTTNDCIVTWDGTSPLQMDQMHATFHLLSNLKWSDGKPLTAADSVYSFQVASDPATPLLKDQIDQTSTYTATDDRTIQWVSKPGLVTSAIEQYFWFPLPQHAWGKMTPQQLLTADEVNKKPIGWGPYMIQNWQAGQSIKLAKNPNYFRVKEGLPKFDFLEFVFLGTTENPVDAVKNGKCDFVENSAISYDSITKVLDAQKANQMQVTVASSRDWEFIALGIKPASYDDGYYPFGVDRPAIFNDVRTRQALAYCIDRATIIKDFIFNLSEVPTSYLTASNPLQPAGLTALPYDPAKGAELLTAAGWMDYDNDPATPRTAFHVKDVPDGTILAMNYYTTNAGLRQQVSTSIQKSLAQCGVKVNLVASPVEDFYKPAPDGLVFGRKFDLAQFSIHLGNKPDCAMFTTDEIPTQMNFWLGKTSGGSNFMGYSNPAVDDACKTALRAGLNTPLMTAKEQEVIQTVNQELPVIPLFYYPVIYLARPDLCGFENDPSARSPFWNIAKWDSGNGCPKK